MGKLKGDTMSYQETYNDIVAGKLDDCLNILAEAIAFRRERLNAKKMNSFNIGDKVKFNNSVKPKYLRGIQATITNVRRKRIEIKLDYSIGRFASRITCPVSLIEKIS